MRVDYGGSEFPVGLLHKEDEVRLHRPPPLPVMPRHLHRVLRRRRRVPVPGDCPSPSDLGIEDRDLPAAELADRVAPLLVREDVTLTSRQRRLLVAIDLERHLDSRDRHHHVDALGFLRLLLDLVVGSLPFFVETLDDGMVR